MARQGFTSADVVDFPPASFAAVANTVTRTNLWTPAIWTSIPAFDMRAGKMYRMTAGGIISTTGAPTVIFNPTFGQSTTPATNIALGASTTTATGTGLANASWFVDFVLGCRQIGVAASTATITGNGSIQIGGPAATASIGLALGGTVVTTADQTTAQGLCLDITWGTASASNTITCQWANVRSLN